MIQGFRNVGSVGMLDDIPAPSHVLQALSREAYRQNEWSVDREMIEMRSGGDILLDGLLISEEGVVMSTWGLTDQPPQYSCLLNAIKETRRLAYITYPVGEMQLFFPESAKKAVSDGTYQWELRGFGEIGGEKIYSAHVRQNDIDSLKRQGVVLGKLKHGRTKSGEMLLTAYIEKQAAAGSLQLLPSRPPEDPVTGQKCPEDAATTVDVDATQYEGSFIKAAIGSSRLFCNGGPPLVLFYTRRDRSWGRPFTFS